MLHRLHPAARPAGRPRGGQQGVVAGVEGDVAHRRLVAQRRIGLGADPAGVATWCRVSRLVLWHAHAQPAQQLVPGTLMTGMLGAGGYVPAPLPEASLSWVVVLSQGALAALWQTGNPDLPPVAVLLLLLVLVVGEAAPGMFWCRSAWGLLRSLVLVWSGLLFLGFAVALQRAGSRPGGRPNFCWVKSLDQKAPSKLRVENSAFVATQALRLACSARTQSAGTTAAHSAAVPPRSGL
ncbi:MAG: hypothetical protein QE285_13505 [Aquabacterium sp.]|nr:hypothetical protein [Aquabacterium sp.]